MNIQYTGLEIIHLGYDHTVYKEKNKEARNLTLLEAAVRDEPQVDRYRYYLGREYLILKRFAEAKQMLESVFKLDQVDPVYFRETNLAHLQCLFDMRAPFEDLLSKAISILESTPQEADAWYFLSLIYDEQGYEEESIEALIQALHYVDNLDANVITSRLTGERAKAEAVLAKYYAEQSHQQDKARSGITRLGLILALIKRLQVCPLTHLLQWSMNYMKLICSK